MIKWFQSRSRSHSYLWIFLLIGALCAVAVVGAIFTYGVFAYQWDFPMARRFAAVTHIPAARVGSKFIPYTEYLAELDAEKRFLSGPAARAQGLPQELTKEVRVQALERLIRIASVEEFSVTRNLVVTPLDVDRVYDGLVAQAGTSTTPEEIHSFLNDQFGWNEQEFKHYVVRPALMEDVLKQKKMQETQDPNAFEDELQARIAKPDVVRYLKI
jgi:hypothetical protein